MSDNYYKLRDWIPMDKLNWSSLSINPNSIHLVKEQFEKEINQHENRINWYWGSEKPDEFDLIEVPEKTDWHYLSKNPNAIDLIKHQLEKNKYKIILDMISWEYLSENPNAIPLLEKRPEKIRWEFLSKNPNAIHLLEKNQDKIEWHNLSENPNAIDLLKKHPEEINWYKLSGNPNAIDLIKEQIEKEKNPNEEKRINWRELSGNPSIFTYDYDGMKEKNKSFAEHLIKTVFHPDRVFDRVKRGMEFDDVVLENYSNYILPHGKDIMMIDQKPTLAPYEVF